jgi:hypothetical protein
MQQSCRPSAKRTEQMAGRTGIVIALSQQPSIAQDCIVLTTSGEPAGAIQGEPVAPGADRRAADQLVKRLQRGAGHKSPLGRRLHLRPARDAQRIRRVSQ